MRAPRRSAAWLCAVALAGLGLAVSAPAHADPPTGGTPLLAETFQGATVADPAWEARGGACLTAATSAGPQLPDCSAQRVGAVPAMGATPGYLQLTDEGENRTGSVLFNRALPANEGLSVTFTTYQYGSRSVVAADGIGFFLVDGAGELAEPGADGGSLGYAQRLQTEAHLSDDVLPGVSHGYLGVGLDVFGNNVNDGENRGQGCTAPQVSQWRENLQRAPHTITVRGPGNGTKGYCFLTSTTGPQPSNPGPYQVAGTTLHGPGTLGAASLADSERRVNIEVTPAPSPQVIVQVQYEPGGQWYEELRIDAPAGTPDTYKFGLSASTGTQRDIHLIRNVEVSSYRALPAINLVKQVDLENPLPSPLQAGSVIPYQYVVTNAGETTLTDLAIADDKLSGVVCPTAPVPPTPAVGSTVVCTGSYTVTAADVEAGEITNVATASATSGTDTAVSEEATVTVPLDSGITLEKSVVTPAPYHPGQEVEYRYVVRNIGQVAVSGLAVKDDRIASDGNVGCPQDALAPGEQVTCTATIPVDGAALDADGRLVNTATATATSALNQELSDTDDESIPVATDIAVTKTVDDATPHLGSTVTFTVRATNNGPVAATGVVVRDLLPAGLLAFVDATPSAGTYDRENGLWTIPALAVGEHETLSIKARVESTATTANTAALVSVDQGDIDPSNDAETVPVNGALHDIAIHKSVQGGVTAIRVGQTVTYEISATNVGTVSEGHVTVHDVLPVGLELVSAEPSAEYAAGTGTWTVGTLAVGQTRTLALTVRATQVGHQVTNVAALTGSDPEDRNGLNDSSQASVDVGPRLADLAVDKAAIGASPVTPGSTLVYVLTVRNNGPDDAPDTVVRDPGVDGITPTAVSAGPSQGTFDLASGRWDVGNLVVGGSARVEITATVDPGAASTHANTATVLPGSDVVDPEPGNNADSAAVLVTQPDAPLPDPVDVGVEITVASDNGAPLDAVPVGDTVTFTLRATNVVLDDTPPTTVTDAVFHTSLPGLVSVLSDSGDGTLTELPTTAAARSGIAALAAGDDPDFAWSVPSIAPGATVTHTIRARAVATGQVIAPLSLASLAQADTNPDNNSDATGLVIVDGAQLSLTKTASPQVARPDQDVTFTVTVRNGGTAAADQVDVAEALPVGATVVSVEPSAGTFDATTRRWSVGALDAGASATLDVTLRLGTTGLHANTAVIEQTGVGDDPADDADTAQVFVPAADLAVTKTVDDASPEVGDEVRFTVGVTNLGPDASTAVAVRDVLPAGLEHVSSTASRGEFDASTGVWTLGELAPVTLPHTGGPQATLTVVARVSTAGRLVNTASVVTSDESTYDPDPSNDSASLEVRAVAAPTPTPTATPTPTTTPPVGTTPGGLAPTGADVTRLVGLAVALVLLSGLVLLVSHRLRDRW